MAVMFHGFSEASLQFRESLGLGQEIKSNDELCTSDELSKFSCRLSRSELVLSVSRTAENVGKRQVVAK